MKLNVDIKQDGQWLYPAKPVVCDEIMVALDPYEQDYLSVRMISENEIGVFTMNWDGDAEECVFSKLIDEP